MKTSVIRYRVADFLREYQPFDVLEMEDLLTLSGTGRVVFHEDDIQLYAAGQPRDERIWVIQQGQVEILIDTPAGPQLRDILEPGDIIGLETGTETRTHTARTATEVILYCFDLARFEELTGRYPEAIRYLTAHLTAGSKQTKALQSPATRERLLSERERSVWLNSAGTVLRPTGTCPTCPPETTVGEAARRLSSSGGDAIAVIDGNGSPIGAISGDELMDGLVLGNLREDWPVGKVMNAGIPTVAARTAPRDLWLRMISEASDLIAITDDGTSASPLCGLITDRDLEIDSGRNPRILLRRLAKASSVEELSYLAGKVRAFIDETLAGPSAVDWCAKFKSAADGAVAMRALAIAIDELDRAGRKFPGAGWCAVFFGDAGRADLVSFDMPLIGMVYASEDDGGNSRYFDLLTAKTAAKLCAAGMKPVEGRDLSARCEAEWRDFYSAIIRDPIGGDIYRNREYFDFQSFDGDQRIWKRIVDGVGGEIRSSDVFLPILANDTMANQPPLAFYQGAVVDSEGRSSSALDLERAILTPLADAARVLAFGLRDFVSADTPGRLRRAVASVPQFASIIVDASEAWRIAAYHQARAGLDDQMHPAYAGRKPALTRFDQRMIKSAFDSTRRFLELASGLDYRVLR